MHFREEAEIFLGQIVVIMDNGGMSLIPIGDR